MSQSKTDIYVYAYWQRNGNPKLIGVLSINQGKKSIQF
jgi:serine/threonine-protein kinase HipA